MDGDAPRLVETAGGGTSLFYRGRWIHSRFAPVEAAAKTALSADILPETLYIIASPGLGYGLMELASRLPDDSAILCLEADPALLRLSAEAFASSRWSDPCRTCLAPVSEAVAAYRRVESRLRGGKLRRVAELRLSGGRSLDDGAYDSAIAAIRDDMSTRFRNRLAMVRMGRLWLRNTISNLASMEWNRCAALGSNGKPVVACGAGPSLDAALPDIGRHRNDLFVLACDTAAGALAAAGIEPDAVVCLEAQIYNVADYLPLGGAELRHIVDISAHPSTFRAAKGPVTLVGSEWMEGSFWSRLASAGLPISSVPPLGSVGVLAINIARALGGQVFLAGLDFSFPAGRTHCVGSPANLAENRAASRLSRRPGAWKATYRDGAFKMQSGWISDPALSMYAGLARAELSGFEAYDLRDPACAPLPAIASTIEAHPAAVGEERRFGLSDDGSSADRARRFLSSESTRVKELASMLRTGADEETLRAALSEADFLYAHFPDAERVSAFELDALKRVAAEAAYWAGRIDEALGA